MSKPLQRAAAQCVVDYLKATQSLGRPLKERIDVLFDAAFVAGVIGKEHVAPCGIAAELGKFELEQRCSKRRRGFQMKKTHRAHFKQADLGTTLGLSLDDPISLIKEIRAGLRVGIINDLARLLGLPIQRVMRAMAISARTLARRKRARRLHKEESEPLVRIVLMLRAAARLFSGDMARAALWISTANPAPLDLADTAPGYEAVRDLIGRIEHGVFS